jgi:hypothetical protein
MWQTRLALCFLLLLAATLAENGVHIRSQYNQLVTSSTLQWVAADRGSYPENAVVGASDTVQGAARYIYVPCAVRTLNIPTHNSHTRHSASEKLAIIVPERRHVTQ